MVETVFIYSANELASYIPPRKLKGKKKKTPKKKFCLYVTFETFVKFFFCDQISWQTGVYIPKGSWKCTKGSASAFVVAQYPAR